MTTSPDRHETIDAGDYANLPSWPVRILWDRTTHHTAPACGSAAAVTVGLAAALAGKVARRSHAQLPDADQIAGRADELRQRAGELAGADAAAVTAMIHGSGPAPQARSLPVEIGEVAAEVVQLAARLAAHGNPALHADAVGAEHLAQAARAATEAIRASNAVSD